MRVRRGQPLAALGVVLDDQAARREHEAPERVSADSPGSRSRIVAQELVLEGLEPPVDEVLLGREVVEDRLLGDVGGARDLGDVTLEAALARTGAGRSRRSAGASAASCAPAVPWARRKCIAAQYILAQIFIVAKLYPHEPPTDTAVRAHVRRPAAAMLLAALDQTIVATALPTIVARPRRDRPAVVGRHRLPARRDGLDPAVGPRRDLYGRKRLFRPRSASSSPAPR